MVSAMLASVIALIMYGAAVKCSIFSRIFLRRKQTDDHQYNHFYSIYYRAGKCYLYRELQIQKRNEK